MKTITIKVILLLATSSIGCLGQQKLRNESVQAEMIQIHYALKSYKLLAGNYPTTEQGLEVLCEKPSKPPAPKRWVRAVKAVPKDPWARIYQYRYQDGAIKLWSKGPAEDDPGDDIVFKAPKEKG